MVRLVFSGEFGIDSCVLCVSIDRLLLPTQHPVQLVMTWRVSCRINLVNGTGLALLGTVGRVHCGARIYFT